MSACKACQGRIGRCNKSGYCKACAPKHAMPADLSERIAAGLRRKIATDPVFKDALRKRALEHARSERAQDARRERFLRDQVWRVGGAASRTPEATAKRGRSVSETRLAWCPRELRDQYRYLVKTKRLLAAEAREIVLAQHERDMTQFRRSIGG